MAGSMDHGMPPGTAGGDGVTYKGAPDLQAAISLVTAGGAAGHFSLVKARDGAWPAPKVANAEVAKLTKQYGAAKVASFVAVQNFAVNDAVKIATAAGVKFPSPTLHGTALAKRVVGLGLVNGTYYEGTQLDHLVTNKIHEAVMDDIEQKFGAAADANYHRIANQAHYDLAQALGVEDRQAGGVPLTRHSEARAKRSVSERATPMRRGHADRRDSSYFGSCRSGQSVATTYSSFGGSSVIELMPPSCHRMLVCACEKSLSFRHRRRAVSRSVPWTRVDLATSSRPPVCRRASTSR